MAGLKIEGRLKNAEYVANITRHYRMAVDQAATGRPVIFTRRQVEEMELSFSRGFSVGWLHGNNHKELVQGRNPRNMAFSWATFGRSAASAPRSYTLPVR